LSSGTDIRGYGTESCDVRRSRSLPGGITWGQTSGLTPKAR
jgi:hypothetical protein